MPTGFRTLDTDYEGLESDISAGRIKEDDLNDAGRLTLDVGRGHVKVDDLNDDGRSLLGVSRAAETRQQRRAGKPVLSGADRASITEGLQTIPVPKEGPSFKGDAEQHGRGFSQSAPPERPLPESRPFMGGTEQHGTGFAQTAPPEPAAPTPTPVAPAPPAAVPPTQATAPPSVRPPEPKAIDVAGETRALEESRNALRRMEEELRAKPPGGTVYADQHLMERDRAELDRMEEQLRQSRPGPGTATPESVAEYNRQVTEYQQRVKGYNDTAGGHRKQWDASIAGYNQQLEAYQKAVEAHNARAKALHQAVNAPGARVPVPEPSVEGGYIRGTRTIEEGQPLTSPTQALPEFFYPPAPQVVPARPEVELRAERTGGGPSTKSEFRAARGPGREPRPGEMPDTEQRGLSPLEMVDIALGRAPAPAYPLSPEQRTQLSILGLVLQPLGAPGRARQAVESGSLQAILDAAQEVAFLGSMMQKTQFPTGPTGAVATRGAPGAAGRGADPLVTDFLRDRFMDPGFPQASLERLAREAKRDEIRIAAQDALAARQAGGVAEGTARAPRTAPEPTEAPGAAPPTAGAAEGVPAAPGGAGQPTGEYLGAVAGRALRIRQRLEQATPERLQAYANSPDPVVAQIARKLLQERGTPVAPPATAPPIEAPPAPAVPPAGQPAVPPEPAAPKPTLADQLADLKARAAAEAAKTAPVLEETGRIARAEPVGRPEIQPVAPEPVSAAQQEVAPDATSPAPLVRPTADDARRLGGQLERTHGLLTYDATAEELATARDLVARADQYLEELSAPDTPTDVYARLADLRMRLLDALTDVERDQAKPGEAKTKRLLQEQKAKAEAPPPSVAAAPDVEGWYDTHVIRTDPERFQFRKGADEETGATKAPTKRYDPAKGDPLLVWRDPANGQVYVVDGHHRLEAATSQGEPQVRVKFLQAATAEEARAKGAVANLEQGKATQKEAMQAVGEAVAAAPEQAPAPAAPADVGQFMDEAGAYTRSIRNADKRDYAQLYAAYLAGLRDVPPDRGAIHVMGAQAVRLHLQDLADRWRLPAPSEPAPAGGTLAPTEEAPHGPGPVRADRPRPPEGAPPEAVPGAPGERPVGPIPPTAVGGGEKPAGRPGGGGGGSRRGVGGGKPGAVPPDRVGPAEPGTPPAEQPEQPVAPAGGEPPAEPTPTRPPVPVEATAEEAAPPSPVVPRPADYVITDGDKIGQGGPKTKARRNIEAIKVLKAALADGRPATPEEQQLLVQYVGWGGIPQVFDPYNDEFKREYAILKDLLPRDEWLAARDTTINAHYTSPEVIRAMWEGIRRLGFARGRVLEPGGGIGHFFGLMPPEMAATGRRTLIEIDPMTGGIAKLLYPGSDIRIQGFEQAKLPANFYDLAIGNVPFGNVPITDPRYPRLLTSRIHNYFFVRSLDVVRPGGVVAYITSKGTLDATDEVARAVRGAIAKQADLLGAVRLPRTAFLANAGTEVVTDILFLRKRLPGEDPAGQAFLETEPIKLKGTKFYGERGFEINEYFHAHPEQVVGTFTAEGSMYGGGELTVDPPAGYSAALAAAIGRLPAGSYTAAAPPKGPTVEAQIQATPEIGTTQPFGYAITNGAIYQNVGGEMVRVKLKKEVDGKVVESDPPPAHVARVQGLIAVRDAAQAVVKAMQTGTDAAVTRAQALLGARYDNFVLKHGPITTPANRRVFAEDPDWPLLLSLEHFDRLAKTATKADIFTRRTINPPKVVERVETGKEALLVSLNELGRVDLDRMAQLTGQSVQALTDGLAGVIYHNPETNTWETADAYLSGPVRAKLVAAEGAAAVDPAFKPNVEALKAVQPADLTPSQINARPGAPWMPTEDLEGFIAHLFPNEGAPSVSHTAAIGAWSIRTGASRWTRNSPEATALWGTTRVDGVTLLEDAMNGRLPVVRDTDRQTNRSWVNQQETIAAQEKQRAIVAEFNKWLWAEGDRAARLSRLYNDRMNDLVKQKFDGSHMEFPGKSPLITFRRHQVNGVWRTIQGGNTLLGHDVGTGKTFTMIAAAMELRRLGLAKKPMIVVPNHLAEYWATEFLRLYPAAKVLKPTKPEFQTVNRRRFLNRVATGDWDAIIVTHSQFSRMPVHPDVFRDFVGKQLDELERAIIEEMAAGATQRSPSVKQLVRARKALQAKLDKRLDKAKGEAGVVYFEESGVDHLFVDEADLFKNLFFVTRMGRVAGVATSESTRALDMFIKTQQIQQRKPGHGVVFATGTPISNSMVEAFTMQRYLQHPALEAKGLAHFDAWAQSFGFARPDVEKTVTGDYRVVARFNSFINIQDLMAMFHSVLDVVSKADVHKAMVEEARAKGLPDPLPLEPPLRGGKVQIITADPTPAFKEFMGSLKARAEDLGHVDPSVDNMLKITSDARKASLDMRLVGAAGAAWDPQGKVAKGIREIIRVHKETAKDKGTQLIFLDLSTPKGRGGGKKTGAPAPVVEEEATLPEDPDAETAIESPDEILIRDGMYATIKDALIKGGVPARDIAFIHEAKTDAKKTQLYDDVNTGTIRILIGSTEKMGAGTNVQQRLVWLHHLDAPWRPRDIEQREGRIRRQGNKLYEADPEHFTIGITRYGLKDSMDELMWQRMAQKAEMIRAIIRGELTARTVEDLDRIDVSYAEMMAAVSGNPLVLEQVALSHEYTKLQALEAAHHDEAVHLRMELSNKKYELAGYRKSKVEAIKDAAAIEPKPTKETYRFTVGDTVFTERGEKLSDALGKAGQAAAKRSEHLTVASFRGIPVVVFGNHFYLDMPSGYHGWIGTFGVQGIEHAVEGMTGRPHQIDEQIPKIEKEIANIERAQTQRGAFEHADRLREVGARLAEIDAALLDQNKITQQGGDAAAPEAETGGTPDSEEAPPPDDEEASDQETAYAPPLAAPATPPPTPPTGMPPGPQSHTPQTPGYVPPGQPGAQPIDVVKARKDIIAALSTAMGRPILTGHFKKLRALGIFKVGPEAIRGRFANDLETHAHEVGHLLQKYLWPQAVTGTGIGQGLSAAPLRRWARELIPLAYPGAESKLIEGFAEFVRYYLTQPAVALQQAPTMYRDFEAKLAQQDPIIREGLEAFRKDFQDWQHATPLARGKAQIHYDSDRLKFPGWRRAWDHFYEAAWDNLDPIRRATDAMAQNRRLRPEEHAYILARLTRGDMGKAEAFLKYNTWDYHTRQPTGEPLGAVMRDVGIANKNLGAGLHEWDTYLVARRTVELAPRVGLRQIPQHGVLPPSSPTGMSVADATAIVAMFPEYEPMAARFSAYMSRLAKLIEDAQMLEPGTVAGWRELNRAYAPLYRVMDDTEGWGPMGKRFASLAQPIKKLRGSAREVISPTETAIRNTYAFISLVERNRVIGALADLAEATPGSATIMDKVPWPEAPTRFTLEEIRKTLEDAGIDLPDQVASMVATVFKPMAFFPKGENLVYRWRKGEREAWQIQEKDLYRALMALGPETWHPLIRFFSAPVRLFKRGITLNPAYVARNIYRDQAGAMIQSETGYLPLIDWGQSVFQVMGADAQYVEWLASGGAQATLTEVNRGALQRQIGDLMRSPAAARFRLILNPLHLAETTSEVAEVSTRLGEYRGAREAGISPEGSSFLSREVSQDFAKMGYITRAINLLVPFFGAWVGGFDKVVRTAWAHPVRFWFHMAALSTISLLLYLANRDEEWYQQMPQGIKDTWWLLKVPGINRPLRIMPKPFDYATIPSTVERLAEWVDKREPGILGRLFTTWSAQFTHNVIPQAVQAPIENFANWSIHFDRPVVPRKYAQLAKPYQTPPGTSPSVAAVAGGLAKIPGLEHAPVFGQVTSPAQLQNLLRGYFGSTPDIARKLADIGMKQAGLVKSGPMSGPTRVEDLPVIGEFFVRFPTLSAKSLTEFYDRWERATEAHTTWQSLVKAHRTEEAKLYRDGQLELLRDYRRLKPHAEGTKEVSGLSTLRQKAEAIQNSPQLPEQKQQRLDHLYLTMIRRARLALEQSRRAAEATAVPTRR